MEMIYTGRGEMDVEMRQKGREETQRSRGGERAWMTLSGGEEDQTRQE